MAKTRVGGMDYDQGLCRSRYALVYAGTYKWYTSLISVSVIRFFIRLGDFRAYLQRSLSCRMRQM